MDIGFSIISYCKVSLKCNFAIFLIFHMIMAVEYLLSCNKEKQQPSTREILDLMWFKTLVID